MVLDMICIKAETEINEPRPLANSDVSCRRITVDEARVVNRREMLADLTDRIDHQLGCQITLADVFENERRLGRVDVPDQWGWHSCLPGLRGQPRFGRGSFTPEPFVENRVAVGFGYSLFADRARR